MERLENACKEHEANLSLLAAGALPESTRARLQEHVAACDRCRDYYMSIRNVTESLAGWQKHFVHVEPSHAAQIRWANAIKAARPPDQHAANGLRVSLWWRELIWSCRHAWTGFALVWLALWIINLASSPRQPLAIANGTTPTPAIMQALSEQQQLLTELIGPARERTIEPEPGDRPKPRSERTLNWKVT